MSSNKLSIPMPYEGFLDVDLIKNIKKNFVGCGIDYSNDKFYAHNNSINLINNKTDNNEELLLDDNLTNIVGGIGKWEKLAVMTGVIYVFLGAVIVGLSISIPILGIRAIKNKCSK